jgi:hypothetical protein
MVNPPATKFPTGPLTETAVEAGIEPLVTTTLVAVIDVENDPVPTMEATFPTATAPVTDVEEFTKT